MSGALRGRKVHTTALALLPPESLWEPIQEIRRKHDKHLSRWPQPHINLLYPFVPSSEFDAAAELLRPILARIAPFRIRLRSFKYFVHGKRSATLWLNPECDPACALDELQKALTDCIPFANDLRERFEGKFSGHISVGQFPGESAVGVSQQAFQTRWKEVEFTADELVFLSREGSTEDRFRIEKRLSIGASPSPGPALVYGAAKKGRTTRVSPKVQRKPDEVQAEAATGTSTYSRSLSSRSTASDGGDDIRTSEECVESMNSLAPYGLPPASSLSGDKLATRERAAVNVITGMLA